jgi:hypothetical protein
VAVGSSAVFGGVMDIFPFGGGVLVSGATTGQKQSADREYKCYGLFHGLIICLMCDFGLT